uniref:Uncharacterized protein n=2 Tax=Aegilops tauschii subsp. strangulata TaxID=200361 RepID=A0A453PJT6_AEGTS
IYLLIGFLSPMVDPKLDPSVAHDGHALPNRRSGEFKHFVRRLPEFKFWYACSRRPQIGPSLSLAICPNILFLYQSRKFLLRERITFRYHQRS